MRYRYNPLNRSQRTGAAILLAALLLTILPACSRAAGKKPAMQPLDGMPAEMKSAPAAVRQAYQFAAANPDLMKQIPCYCGCDDEGHTSNYDCYVSGVEANGTVTYDPHALGCSICVDITQDVMRLLKQGKTVPDIKTYIDQIYSKYGPSNMP